MGGDIWARVSVLWLVRSVYLKNLPALDSMDVRFYRVAAMASHYRMRGFYRVSHLGCSDQRKGW